MGDKLTIKQEKFCQKYIECEGNASEAYRQSYNCENQQPETVNNNAYMLQQHSEVAARIEELQALHLKRHQVTVDRIVAEYSKLAFLDVGKIFNEDGSLKPINEIDKDALAAIAGIEVEEKTFGKDDDPLVYARIKKLKITDKKGALDSLAKYLAMFTDKIEHTGTLTLAQLVEASYKKDEK